ncbi:proton-conducting transporter transmembrane domain-containing protein [Thermococcus barophilus]|uniref:Membrane bound subgroup 4b [NiFe]-hydrogenase MBH(B)3, subunit Mbh(B)3H n=1 Tax=Thermococcus barophilus TaxID=55802 RepID=A0A0S1XD71_THEBA|nr:proton-conducting transporter membrane subunit [Thermococcus barophilus]ALM75672.1 Membrane bound subgroup 4b [NiFe]-hydrogenase MBH(b)3, subunit Mbh(b)3H'' [Thermococcus barophilus]
MKMEELFTIAVILFLLSIPASLIFKKSYRLSISAGHALTGLASIALLMFTIYSVPTVVKGGVISFIYDLGVAKIPFQIDGLSLVLCFVLAVLGLATSIYSPAYMEHYEKFGRGWMYVALYSAFVLSMILIVTTSNLLWFLFLWEVMTLASYVLMIWEHDEEFVRKAGWQYFVTMHVTSTLPLVIAVALIYAKAGSIDGLNFDSIRAMHLGGIYYALFLLAFGSKAGAVPVHFWLPDAHPAAPSNISALMSGVMIKVAVYGLIRTTCYLLGLNYTFGIVVALIGTVSLTIGTLYALKQTDAKRLLAYHSVGQMGYIWLGTGVGIALLAKGNPLGVVALAAGLYHLVNHAVFKGLLFLSTGSILYRTHSRDLNKLKGLGKLMPVTAIFTFIAAMSIAGAPPFNGFMSKWLIYQTTFLSGNGLIVFFGVMALFISAATLASFIKFYTTAFGGEPEEITKDAREVPFPMLLGKGILALLCVLLGVVPGVILPLLTSPGKAFVPMSPLATNYWAISLGLSYFKPLLFVMFFGMVAVVLYLAFPPSGKVTRAWTLGEPVSSRDFKFKAVNYYEPFEEYIHGLYHLGEELSHIGGQIVRAVGNGYLELSLILKDVGGSARRGIGNILYNWISGGFFATSTFLSSLGSAFGHIMVAIGRKYTSLRELYLDEFIFSPLIKVTSISYVFEEGERDLNKVMTIAVLVLAVIIVLMVRW